MVWVMGGHHRAGHWCPPPSKGLAMTGESAWEGTVPSPNRPFRLFVAFLILLMLLCLGGTNSLAVERRKDQFPTDFSYLIMPAPYSLPGIGEGILVLGYLGNVISTADIYGYKLFGDVGGVGVGITELPIIPKILLLNGGNEFIDRGVIQLFQTRGMDSRADDFVFAEFSQYNSRYSTVDLMFGERKFWLQYTTWDTQGDLDALRDPKGNLLQQFIPPQKVESTARIVSLIWDGTDDHADPRTGLRAIVSRNLPESRKSVADPNYYVLDSMVNGYLAVGDISTIVFDWFRSRAVVQNKGDTDINSITASYCPTLDAVCIAASTPLINDTLAHNTYGTASSLGGQSRLRAYPGDRFKGAQTEFFAMEFRWNFSASVTPFNWGFWKDIRTGLQLALFAETGSVAETPGDLWKRSRSDAGAGFRMITASGGVYRFDLASGDEGPATTIIVNYPF